MPVFDRNTIIILGSALLLAVLCSLPDTRLIPGLQIIYKGLFVCDALFHEMGHTIFNWLFGSPAIPMIFTIFGSDQAGGMSMTFGHFWVVQIIVFCALGYFCYWAKDNTDGLFIPAIIFSIFIIIIALTGYQNVITSFMGHGGAILSGGFLLFRAWKNLRCRNNLERWLSALFGFYMIVSNFMLCYQIKTNLIVREEYTSHLAFGSMHNDFMAIAMEVPGFTVAGVVIFTMGFCIATLIASFVLSDIYDIPEVEIPSS